MKTLAQPPRNLAADGAAGSGPIRLAATTVSVSDLARQAALVAGLEAELVTVRQLAFHPRLPRPRSRRRLGRRGWRSAYRAFRAVTATTLVVLAASLLASALAQAAPGDLDPTFSGDGMQTADFAVADVALQADDGKSKIVVVGGAGGDFALARYNPDGSLDRTFSGDGMQTTDFAGVSDAAAGVAVQADGKIVAVGRGGGAFALARYNADGSLDPTFAGDGKQTTDFGGGGGEARSVAVQADGRIVVAGGGGGALALARYTSDGSLDPTFSSDGKQTAADPSGWDVALQSDGKIVVVGGSGDFVVLRFNTDGAPDPTFSGDGRQTTDIDGGDQATGVAIQPDGKIVAAGSAGSWLYFALARYSADGSLDPTFSGDGEQIPIFGGTLWGEYATTVAVQPNGKIVAVGHCCDTDLGGDFALARLNGDGSLDASYAGDGRQATDFGGGNDGALAVTIQADGNIVAAGTGASAGVVARYQGGGDAPATAPESVTSPTISGATAEGQTLTVSPGTWSGTSQITVTEYWQRCDTGAFPSCQFIGGATGTNYTLGAADVGRTIRVHEEASSPWGLGAVDSARTAVVTAKPTPGAVAGTVRNARTGAGIANASVSCGSGYSAKTTSGGRYSIANVPPGSHTCTAGASRYWSSTQTVTVSAGQTATANFGLVRQ